MASALLFAALSAAAFAAAPAPSAGLAATPPMGWNSWNRFGCDVDEKLVRETADALVASGMRDAGYRYLVIDDCWQDRRGPGGEIEPDSQRFPSGMKSLGDYLHDRGLKFGLYSDAGTKTCQGRPGSHGYEAQDAKSYAAWGVDFVKYDWCHTEGIDPHQAYRAMSAALAATGRPIVFSMCEWGRSSPWTWARGVAQLWRTTDDVTACTSCRKPWPWSGLGWRLILDKQEGLERFAGPGGWNDPDMLEVGNPGMTHADDRAQFSFWALLAAPLFAGNDVRSMSASTRAVLLNREIIAVDQDPLGEQGRRVKRAGAAELWVKALEGGDRAVILYNRGEQPEKIGFTGSDVGIMAAPALRFRDLWDGKDLPAAAYFEAELEPNEARMLRVGPGR